ncbi:MAG: hypothetical protein ACOYL6_05470 [Bacteriovoracaceae bacterium]
MLKAIWKKLGIKGQVKNFSSKSFWVLETETGKPIAHKLLPMTKSPNVIDADAFRRSDGKSIEAHSSWWKFYDFSTLEIYDNAENIKLSIITKTKVTDKEFGPATIIYEDTKSWGVPLKLVTDVKRDKKEKIVGYFVPELGWLSQDETLALTCKGEIDNARPVFPIKGTPYIRTRRDKEFFNNLATKGSLV